MILKRLIAIAATSALTLGNQGLCRERSLEQSTDLIARWLVAWADSISAETGNIPSPQILFGIGGTSVYGGCTDNSGAVSIPGSYYCPKTNTIILEVSQLEEMRTKHGDGAVIYAVAHEFGHWLQSAIKAPRIYPLYELQADCISGAFLRSASQDILLDSTDMEEMSRTASQIGGSDHGTGSQRVNALTLGVRTGDINTCLDTSQFGTGLPDGSVTTKLPAPPSSRTIPEVERQDSLPSRPVEISPEIAWIRPYDGNLSEKTYVGTSTPKSVALIRTRDTQEILNISDVIARDDGYSFKVNHGGPAYSHTLSFEISCSKDPGAYPLAIDANDDEFNRLASTSLFYSLCPLARIPDSINVDKGNLSKGSSELPRNYETTRIGSVHVVDVEKASRMQTNTLGLVHARGRSFLIEAFNIHQAPKSPSWNFTRGYEFDVIIKDADTEREYIRSAARVSCYEKGARADGLTSGYWPYNVTHKENEFWGALARKSLCTQLDPSE